MNDEKAVYEVLARAVAQRQISDDVIQQFARQVTNLSLKIRWIDICPYGICIDYFVEGEEWVNNLRELVTLPDGRIGKIDVFPYGIPYPDLFRIHVEHNIDAMARG